MNSFPYLYCKNTCVKKLSFSQFSDFIFLPERCFQKVFSNFLPFFLKKFFFPASHCLSPSFNLHRMSHSTHSVFIGMMIQYQTRFFVKFSPINIVHVTFQWFSPSDLIDATIFAQCAPARLLACPLQLRLDRNIPEMLHFRVNLHVSLFSRAPSTTCPFLCSSFVRNTVRYYLPPTHPTYKNASTVHVPFPAVNQTPVMGFTHVFRLITTVISLHSFRQNTCDFFLARPIALAFLS